MLKSTIVFVKKFFLAICFLYVPIFFACSDISGPDTGGVFDTPNMVTGFVVDQSGLAVEGVRVKLKNIEITESGTIESVAFESETESEGIFKFSNVPQGNYIVLANNENFSAINSRVHIDKSDSINIRTLRMQKNVTLAGRVVNRFEEVGNTMATLPGTNSESFLNVNGEYFLNNIPRGDYELAFIERNLVNYLKVRISGEEDTLYLKDIEIAESEDHADNIYSYFTTDLNHFVVTPVFYSNQETPLWYENKSFESVSYFRFDSQLSRFYEIDQLGRTVVMIDDFEYYDLIPLVDDRRGGFMPESGWFIFDDEKKGGNSYFIPEELIDNRKLGLTTQDAHRGQSFHATMVLTEETDFPVLGFGVPFSSYYDMSDLEIVSFYAKGSGDISFSIWTKTVLEDYSLMDNWGHFEQIITLEDNWRHYSLYAEDFAPRPYSAQERDGISWQEANEYVRGFEFMASSDKRDTVTVWVDDVKFIGSKFRKSGEYR